MTIYTKRAYEPAKDTDGYRILVDRLWPRGVSKAVAKIDFWAKDVAPSNELRRWFGHDSEAWPQFKEKYFSELDDKSDEIHQLVDRMVGKDVTLVYSAKSEWNNARALKDYLTDRFAELR